MFFQNNMQIKDLNLVQYPVINWTSWVLVYQIIMDDRRALATPSLTDCLSLCLLIQSFDSMFCIVFMCFCLVSISKSSLRSCTMTARQIRQSYLKPSFHVLLPVFYQLQCGTKHQLSQHPRTTQVAQGWLRLWGSVGLCLDNYLQASDCSFVFGSLCFHIPLFSFFAH